MTINTTYEVTEAQYRQIRTQGAGLVATRHDKEMGKYYVEVWLSYGLKIVERILKAN